MYVLDLTNSYCPALPHQVLPEHWIPGKSA
jgi:hypothetical protein